PTDDEQLVLEMINRARANPFAEGTRLGIDIREGLSSTEQNFVQAMPPLAFNPLLIGTARAHSQDMHDRNFFAHDNPDGKSPFDRMTAAGYSWTRAGENIAVTSAFNGSAAGLEDLLMVDSSVAGRGHRTNLLDILPPPPTFLVRREVGIGYYTNSTASTQGWRTFITQDFGRRSQGPFLVGVVFDDSSSGFYAKTKGKSGVTISHDKGASFAVSSASGGYACLLPTSTSGVVTVTPAAGTSGISWPATIMKKRFLTGENLKVDFTTSDAVDSDNDGMPDKWETDHHLNPFNAADAAMDADGDGATNLEEFQFGSDPEVAASTPSNPQGVVTPPPVGSGGSGGGGGGGGGGCGLTGLEGVLLLALLGVRRR
ncbi:MAG: CAP domain-containing protein, partial [Planctomycetaceae bacterium]|nr:CAP domain-containing protein [Planctomycetaceae bacterium]